MVYILLAVPARVGCMKKACAGKKPQTDEDDMGVSYEHLGVFGRLRKISKLGPVSMFFAVWRLWGNQYSVTEVAEKVKFFFRYENSLQRCA